MNRTIIKGLYKELKLTLYPQRLEKSTEHVLSVAVAASGAPRTLWFYCWLLWCIGTIRAKNKNKSEVTGLYNIHLEDLNWNISTIQDSLLYILRKTSKGVREMLFIWLPTFKELHKRLLSSMITWCDWICIRFAILWENDHWNLGLDYKQNFRFY